MLKFIAIFAASICISLAILEPPKLSKSSLKDSEATVISNVLTNDGAGNFAFNFETSNGIKGETKGNLKKITSDDGKEGLGEVQQGSYSYVGDDGKTYELKWVADENGEHVVNL